MAGFVLAVVFSLRFVLPGQIRPVERERDRWQERAEQLQQMLDLQLQPQPPAYPPPPPYQSYLSEEEMVH